METPAQYLIVAECGGYYDYTIHALCIVKDQARAVEICNQLDQACQLRRKFKDNQLEEFITSYIQANPRPTRPHYDYSLEEFAARLPEITLKNEAHQDAKRVWEEKFNKAVEIFTEQKLNQSMRLLFPENLRNKMMSYLEYLNPNAFCYEVVEVLDDC